MALVRRSLTTFTTSSLPYQTETVSKPQWSPSKPLFNAVKFTRWTFFHCRLLLVRPPLPPQWTLSSNATLAKDHFKIYEDTSLRSQHFGPSSISIISTCCTCDGAQTWFYWQFHRNRYPFFYNPPGLNEKKSSIFRHFCNRSHFRCCSSSGRAGAFH